MRPKDSRRHRSYTTFSLRPGIAALPELNEQALEAFKAHLYAHDGLQSPGAYAIQLSRGARDLIAFLRATGHIPPAAPLEPTLAGPELLVNFHAWMRTHRGTTETTLRNYRPTLLGLKLEKLSYGASCLELYRKKPF